MRGDLIFQGILAFVLSKMGFYMKVLKVETQK